ncbi:nitroreductase [Oleispirillum naphthae]|uniref:nitroreductase n=1 Tax=Oleispirillum naphthae TaxID=2838853 RepID=UPI00308254CB
MTSRTQDPRPAGADVPGSVEEAITSRKSARAFLPTPVPRETVEQVLALAARSPSATNTQPWRVYVAMGKVRDALAFDLCAAFDDPDFPQEPGYAFYPDPMPEPYLSRRRDLGWKLYGLLGIDRGDPEARHKQHGRNFRFFDAPVGLFFTVERCMERGSWLDIGMFMQTAMLAARGMGLHTCPQAVFVPYHKVIRKHLPIPDTEVMACGMSLGYADPAKIENTLVSPRDPVTGFASFLGC